MISVPNILERSMLLKLPSFIMIITMPIGNRNRQSFRDWNVSLSFDLRYSRVFEQIGKRFDDFSPNPLYEIGFERVPGRSFRIDGNNR